MAGRKITVEFLGKDVSAGRTADQVSGRFGALGTRMQKIGRVAGPAIVAGFALAGAAAVKLGQKASDLAETQSKVEQIFGTKSVAALDKFAAGAAKAMGQSKQTALDGAATFGVFGKSAGLAGNDLVGFSTDMTTLASDMASFNNTSPEEAIEALGAALRGESEPIRKYGVLLDDATLRNEALKMGLIKTTKEALTPQQKVLAAQSAIMKQTGDQQGDFARTSDGLANKQRKLTAQLENMGTKIGEKVVPVLLKLTDAGLKMLAWLEKNPAVAKAVVIGLAAIAAVFLAVFVAANWIPLAVGLIVGALVYAYKKFPWFRKGVEVAIKAIGAIFTWLWNSVVQPVMKFLVEAIGWVLRAWGKMLIALSKVPGFGWAKKAGEAMLKAGRGADKLGDSINKIPKDTKIGITMKGFKAAIDTANRLNRAISPLRRANLHISTGRGGAGGIPQNASGTKNWRGGVTWVGEKGPELVDLPDGTAIHSNADSRAMTRRGSSVAQDSRPILVQLLLDGKVIQQSLIKRKRESGAPLGLA